MENELYLQIDRVMAELDKSGMTIMDWLNSKWDQIPEGLYRRYDYPSNTEDIVKIPVSLIAASSCNGLWGDLEYKRQSYIDIVEASLDAYKSRSGYDDWLYKMTLSRLKISLIISVESKHGPLYRISRDGNHRLHVLKAMGITAQISAYLHVFDRDNNIVKFDYQSSDYRVFDMLVRRGYLEQTNKRFHDLEFKRLKMIPSWLLDCDDPKEIAKISNHYKSYYPNFGDDELERIILDPNRLETELYCPNRNPGAMTGVIIKFLKMRERIKEICSWK